MRVDGKVRSWVTTGESEQELRDYLAVGGFVSLREDACEKLAAGTIWVDDAIRALGVNET